MCHIPVLKLHSNLKIMEKTHYNLNCPLSAHCVGILWWAPRGLWDGGNGLNTILTSAVLADQRTKQSKKAEH